LVKLTVRDYRAMDYLYQISKASLVLRVIDYLQRADARPIQFITVLHQLEGWIVRIKPESSWSLKAQADFQAFMQEVGILYSPTERIESVLHALEVGTHPVVVMEHYHILVINHGFPEIHEIEIFCERFVQGLGYRPETLA
jgi:hypothetical protein